MNRRTLQEVLLGKGQYKIGFLDGSVDLPIGLGIREIQFLRKNFRQKGLDERARSLFNWIHANVKYGKSKLKVFNTGYRTATETLVGKEGVCGEMAYLYVASARAIGLRSNYVSVEVDYQGKRVNHGCAGVFTPQLKLADVAYHQYDIHHNKIKVLDDLEMINHFKSWKQNFSFQD